MNKKILILTASPERDKVVDDLLAERLRELGNTVQVRPCLREGRAAVLEFEPDIVIVPPVRNLFSRDFVEQLRRWKVGVVSRHTEASCDWADFKAMSETEKSSVLGQFVYHVDLELVWAEDEAQILNKRPARFKAVPVGSFVMDIYKMPKEELAQRFMSRENFNKKYGFSDDKKTILIGSPWGFADSAPDLQIDEMRDSARDTEGRNRQIEMIKLLQTELSDDWNIMVRPHPGVGLDYYKKALPETIIATELPCTEVLINVDAIVHSGSTMAMEAHALDIPAFQFGDVNAKVKTRPNWWIKPNSPLSRISPYFANADELVAAIKLAERKTNANEETLKILEEGRYGKMDGKATRRAAALIDTIEGKFTRCWPEPIRDYSQLNIVRNPGYVLTRTICNICKHEFYIIRREFYDRLFKILNKQAPNTKWSIPRNEQLCPWCGARFYEIANVHNPGAAQQQQAAE